MSAHAADPSQQLWSGCYAVDSKGNYTINTDVCMKFRHLNKQFNCILSRLFELNTGSDIDRCNGATNSLGGHRVVNMLSNQALDGETTTNPITLTYTGYLDASCNPVSAAAAGYGTCGNMFDLTFWHPSPISLVWKDSGPGEAPSYTRFPLEPNDGGKFVSWRASEAMPLLVYDPEHTGKIVSASQLFGTHSFGRKWENGYQALATLDKNSDRQLTGAELKDLALWFDRNKDAVSQPGEVVSLDKVGIIAISITPDRKDEAAGEIWSSAGYERVVKGVHEVRPSVDWFAKSYAEKIGLREHQELIRQLWAAPAALKDTGAQPSIIDYIGAWNWSSDDAAGPFKAEGTLLFLAEEDTIYGASVVKRQLFNLETGKPETVTATFPLRGKIEPQQDGSSMISFIVAGPKGTTHSVASLSKNKQTLVGKSVGAPAFNPADETFMTYNYDWSAIRR